MGASQADRCRHCEVRAVPVEHRCGAKQRVIDAAAHHYNTRGLRRLRQRWNGREWEHFAR